MSDMVFDRILLKIRSALLLIALILPVNSHAGTLQRLVEGADSGKIAKFEFSLKDTFPVTTVAWSPDGRYIATSSNEHNEVHIWSVRERKIARIFTRQLGGWFNELSWSPDGHYLAMCVFGGGHVRIVSTDDWSERVIQSSGDSGCRSVAFSRDSAELAVLGRGLTVYSTRPWKQIKFIDLQKGWASGRSFRAIGYLPGTHTILLGGDDLEAYREERKTRNGSIWFLKSEEQASSHQLWAYVAPLGEVAGDVQAFSVSPSGLQVATSTRTGSGVNSQYKVTASVHVFDLSNDALIANPLDGVDTYGSGSVAFTRDGKYLLVGSRNIEGEHPIRILSTSTYKVVDTVNVSGTVYAVDSSPDGKYFAAGAGGGIFVWSLKGN